MALDLAGIAASAGSACHAGALEPSPVLQAMGLSEERVAASFRFSFGPEHSGGSGSDIADRVIAALRGD
jgi:cysteine desulfurase